MFGRETVRNSLPRLPSILTVPPNFGEMVPVVSPLETNFGSPAGKQEVVANDIPLPGTPGPETSWTGGSRARPMAESAAGAGPVKRKSGSIVIPLLAFLLFALPGHAGTLRWTLPSSYTDGSPIDPADVRKIVVRVYAGPSRTGPWKWIATSDPGSESIGVSDPEPGETYWYVSKAVLGGVESGFSAPVRRTNLAVLNARFGKKVLRRIRSRKREAILGSVFLLAVLAGGIRYGLKRRKNRSDSSAGPDGPVSR